MIKYIAYNILTTEVVGGAMCSTQELYEGTPKDSNCEYLIVNGNPLDYIGKFYVVAGELLPFDKQELEWKKNPPLGYRFKMPERQLVDCRTLQQAKDQKWKEIKSIRNTKENGTFFYNGLEFDADKEHITGAVQLAILSRDVNRPFNINWTLHDNTEVSLTATELVELGITFSNYINDLYDKARKLRKQIENCETNSDVDKINW